MSACEKRSNAKEDEETPPDSFPVMGIEEIVRRLPHYFTISCASKRNSGKTVLISELIQTLLKEKRVDMVMIMSGSAGLNHDYEFLPKKLVTRFNEATLKSIWASQKDREETDRPHILIVLDDCLATPEALRNNTINAFYSLGRHVMCSFIIISQHTTHLLSPLIKANSDVILWSKLNRGQLKTLWEATTNITLKDFIRLSESLGGIHYQFMLLDNYTASIHPTEFLAVVKAKPPKPPTPTPAAPTRMLSPPPPPATRR